jgi:hypothetical protein
MNDVSLTEDLVLCLDTISLDTHTKDKPQTEVNQLFFHYT